MLTAPSKGILTGLALFALFMLIMLGVTGIYIAPKMGYPMASYWSLSFFIAASALAFMLRHAFDRDLPPVNFLNRNYYSFSVFFALLILVPLLFFLLRIVLTHSGSENDKYMQASSVLVGRVYSISAADNLVKFEVLQNIKAAAGASEAAESGLVEPTGCFFNIEVGDIFLVYLQQDVIGTYVLTCHNMKRLEEKDLAIQAKTQTDGQGQ